MKPATTPPRTRSRSRCGSTTSPRASLSRRRPTATRDRTLPETGRRDDHRRPLGPGGRRDQLPAARRRELGGAADQARPRRCRRLGAPGRGHPAGPRAGHLPVPGRRGRTRRATPLRARVAPTAPRWRCAGSRSRSRGRGGRGERAKTRLFARLRWRHRSGPRITVPFDAAAILSGRLVDADGAGLAGRALRVVSRPSRGALAESRESTRSAPDRTAASGCRSRRGPRGASPSASSARTASTARAAPASPCGCAAASRSAPRRARSGPDRSSASRGGSTPAGRRSRAAASWSRSSTTRAPPDSWRPVLFVRSDRSGHFRARYRFRYVSGSARIRFRAVALAEERWPYSTGASAPVVIRVSG